MTRYTHALRLIAAGALVSTLAACVVSQPAPRPAPPPPPGPNPHEVAVDRLHQVDNRIDNLGHRIDMRVSQGYYPPPQGGALHHRLDTIRGEAHDMAAQHGGGISPDEQRVLNQELDTAARAIGE
ncbi:hypothetical protein E1N52_13985 [Paraburkholderia guartelaensis]|uniref:Lipoprotein n=1 Tax=Paraburkholderia guartelaensis TaxID=2546446 RepID=A0A4R5LFX4_9BURK|nr:hypothetical protein [Paraburkholderia guartelaensis]TDG07889.1 hypothetical protein E1N52_13985 [Paraburkholderia guartelaensis]